MKVLVEQFVLRSRFLSLRLGDWHRINVPFYGLLRYHVAIYAVNGERYTSSMLKMTDGKELVTGRDATERLVAQSVTIAPPAILDAHGLNPVSLGPVQALVDELAREMNHRKRSFWITLAAVVGSLLSLFAVLNSLITTVPVSYVPLLLRVSHLLALVPYALLVPAILLVRPSARRRNIIGTMISCDDVRTVDPLLNNLGTANMAIRDLIVTRLSMLLPQLEERDNIWLSESANKMLIGVVAGANSGLMRKLYGKQWQAFVVSAIKALGQVGDYRAVGPVRALATGVAETDDARLIQQAARESLEPLLKRIEQERVGLHLLRSSEQPDSGVDTLLKPVIETPVTDTGELPRPSRQD